MTFFFSDLDIVELDSDGGGDPDPADMDIDVCEDVYAEEEEDGIIISLEGDTQQLVPS